MCTTCGCGEGEIRVAGIALSADTHTHADGTAHSHAHSHPASHGYTPAASRRIKLEQDILAKNNAYAAQNRAWLAARGIFALNLVSSPGSGKTTLLVKTIEAFNARSGNDVRLASLPSP